jgi:predicted DNA-binding protein
MDNKDEDKQAQRTRIVTVRLTEATYRQLKILAATKGKDNAQVVTEAIELAAREGGAS